MSDMGFRHYFQDFSGLKNVQWLTPDHANKGSFWISFPKNANRISPPPCEGRDPVIPRGCRVSLESIWILPELNHGFDEKQGNDREREHSPPVRIGKCRWYRRVFLVKNPWKRAWLHKIVSKKIKTHSKAKIDNFSTIKRGFRLHLGQYLWSLIQDL